MRHLYPVYIDLKNRQCLVIGGGKVAERKIANLLEYGAQVTIVSPQVEANIRIWAAEETIVWYKREFTEHDLQNVFMVFIATDNSSLNGEVAEFCRQKGILVNAVDDPSNCDFFVPSIIRHGSLVISISTGGNSPLFAKKLRTDLEKVITPEYGEFIEMLGETREYIKKNVPDIEVRKKIFASLVYSDILDLLKVGEKEKAREKMETCMSSWLD
ncbi:MAG: bifunctional precorrin-2 dehydrogenase/sirohydrochlorin ferrochelatase [Syntrophomonadaceae bacterium]|nr:bifunctional precorrin-2 dehydrogenase/sirohydrochlorin ferrochelatase [Syntrophomonadaceae bacterium]MDD3888456.1 bifunctional precorrin-2 dehydrogenase/sirohydrochlorin ferrochelatase [Syntrophomonadaceae bacterium]MDD4549209.1 bifunctional precorrin-2 dehydrogenase/sirohydrochlorin ferrochelatase [Syntrophomonadaceae bacterium]